MFCRDSMPRAHDSALQERKSAFYGIGVDISHDIDAPAVIDGLVLALVKASFHHSLGVANPIVGDNHVHVSPDILADILGERSGLSISDMEETQIPATFADSNNNLFLGSMWAASTALHPANVGFIHLYRAAQWLFTRFDHGATNAMAEIPRRLVGGLEHALEL